MEEKVQIFGAKQNLVGILHPVEQVRDQSGGQVVIILNSGLVAKAGPFRVNAELSMKLQRSGIPSFRFDLSGIGDSLIPVNDSRHYQDRNLDDIGEAVELVHNIYPNNQIVVLGLCTGADLAHRASCRFDKISGAILLDGYGYPTTRYYWNRLNPYLSSFSGFIEIVNKVLHLPFRYIKRSSVTESVGADKYIWELPSKDEYLKNLAELRDRKCRQLYVYSSGVWDYYNYESQLYDSIDDKSLLQDITVIMNKFADHTYIMLQERRNLFNTIIDWIKQAKEPDKSL